MIEPAIERGNAARDAQRKPPVEAMPVYDAKALTKGDRRAAIRLNDQIYTLYITRQGKLLLTK
ncbi:MAG: hemin uptake protein HemP [Pseudomonadota bacterium]